MVNITDEMVERAAEAAYMADIFRLRTESDIWLTWETLAKAAPTTAAERYRRMARAALESALGDVEPLGDLAKLALSGRIDDIIGQAVNGHIGIGTATDMITGLFATYAVANAKGADQ